MGCNSKVTNSIAKYLKYISLLSLVMAPNESIATESQVSTYKVVDKAMDIPIVNDVVMGLKKIADPITPYVEGTLKIVKDKADSSLSEDMRGKVGRLLNPSGLLSTILLAM